MIKITMPRPSPITIKWETLPRNKVGVENSWSMSTSAVFGHRLYVVPLRNEPSHLYVLDMQKKKWRAAEATGDVPRVLGLAPVVQLHDKMLFVETSRTPGSPTMCMFILDVITEEWSIVKLCGKPISCYYRSLTELWEDKGSILILSRQSELDGDYTTNAIRVDRMETQVLADRIGPLRPRPPLKHGRHPSMDQGLFGWYHIEIFSSVFLPAKQQWLVCCGSVNTDPDIFHTSRLRAFSKVEAPAVALP